MVKLLQEEEATDTAKFVFSDIKQTFGMIPNLFKAMAAADPGWLEMNRYSGKKNKRAYRICSFCYQQL